MATRAKFASTAKNKILHNRCIFNDYFTAAKLRQTDDHPLSLTVKKLSISCDLHLQDLSLFVIHKTQITRYQRYSYDSQPDRGPIFRGARQLIVWRLPTDCVALATMTELLTKKDKSYNYYLQSQEKQRQTAWDYPRKKLTLHPDIHPRTLLYDANRPLRLPHQNIPPQPNDDRLPATAHPLFMGAVEPHPHLLPGADLL